MADNPSAYIVDIPYSTYYYAEQSPTVLNFLAKRNGAKGRPEGQPFIYCDLGCGNGLTCNTLAASNPDSTFYGIDFNPVHIAKANTLANRTGLDNVQFIEGAFGDFSGDDLPKFDYITMHGIYSWVSPAVQADTRTFIATFLKPGGIVYVSYNTLPGWAPFLPIREILRTFTQGLNLGPIERIGEGVKILNMLVERKSPYTAASARIRREIKRTGKSGRNYLAHEFLNDCWAPRYFTDVAAEMSSVDLTFCSLAALRTYAADTRTLAKFSELLSRQQGVVKREATKSILLNERFRRDVYLDSADAMTNDPVQELSSVVIGNARSQRLSKEAKVDGRFAGAGVVYDAVFQGCHTLSDILALPGIQKFDAGDVLAEIHTLINQGWVRPFAGPSRWDASGELPDRIHMPALFNRVLLSDYLASGHGCWLASPVSGDGIEIDQNSALLLQAAMDVGVSGAANRAFEILGETGNPLWIAGKRVADPKSQRFAIRKNFMPFRAKLTPVLLRLGILEELT